MGRWGDGEIFIKGNYPTPDSRLPTPDCLILQTSLPPIPYSLFPIPYSLFPATIRSKYQFNTGASKLWNRPSNLISNPGMIPNCFFSIPRTI
ncbi:MAG: hypothetical protein F6J98_26930, partial [Moorea sp. SIO4G2]|nr:hypothetical protein [Moorena sp. SIO4G2]